MKRRIFLTKSILGVGASLAIPGNIVFGRLFKPAEKKLGIALVGLGKYSTDQLAPALQETTKCELRGIVTGSPDKAEKWQKKYNIPTKNIYNYENFDTIKDNPDIDIVYVVLPNAMHGEYTIRAAKAGKHVICEKPMEVSADKCQQMINACKENNRLLSIGYRLHFEPHHKTMMELGSKKTYGNIKKIKAEHGFGVENNVWRVDKKLAGGGPLMDVGIYCLQGAIYTVGKKPVAVSAKFGEVTDQERFKEVEESIKFTLEFPGGTIAECNTSYSEGMNMLRAEADKGWFELSPAFSYGGIKGESSGGKMNISNVNQQARQMDDFADCVLKNKASIVPGEMGMRDVKIMEAIYEAARTGKKVSLNL